MQKEVGLSRTEIFGGKEFIQVEEKIDREGKLGSWIDYMVGKRTRKKVKEVRHSPMNAKTFHTYLDLLNEEQEEKKKAQDKAKMKAKSKGAHGGSTTGFGGKTP